MNRKSTSITWMETTTIPNLSLIKNKTAES